jgi:hypothetical protein
MLTSSFRSIVALSALAIVGLIQAGCGEGRKDVSSQVVEGNGFLFAAPAGWDVTRSARQLAAAGEKPALVSVQVFPLTRAYRPALFEQASRELDRVAGDLARGLGGSVSSARTVTIDGARARQYELRYRDLLQEITFVLSGRREYQLLCRRKADAEGDACAQLVTSFRRA